MYSTFWMCVQCPTAWLDVKLGLIREQRALFGINWVKQHVREPRTGGECNILRGEPVQITFFRKNVTCLVLSLSAFHFSCGSIAWLSHRWGYAWCNWQHTRASQYTLSCRLYVFEVKKKTYHPIMRQKMVLLKHIMQEVLSGTTHTRNNSTSISDKWHKGVLPVLPVIFIL